MFKSTGLPSPSDAEAVHPKVAELRNPMAWTEGSIWCSPATPTPRNHPIDNKLTSDAH
jgi:hypothetical protein